MSGIYLHIPFCKQACHYCDFHFSTSMKKKGAMLGALEQELILRSDEFDGVEVETIYFGGGTPSVLEAFEIEGLIKTIYSNYKVSSAPEVTLEANPDDLSQKKLRELADANINRLSIGIQSFFDEDLKLMNRAHNAQESETCLENALKLFDNLSVDLIYGIPGMSNQRWVQNIEKALSYDIPHISSYALTVEPRTALASFIEKGLITAPDDEVAQQQFELLVTLLEEQGYIHYEISNFGRPGFFSKNNTAYWLGKKYLGIGPSAHSYNGSNRSWNIRNNHKYIRHLQQRELPSELEKLTVKDRYNEYIMTRLRTIWGVSLKKVETEFGALYAQYLKKQAKNYVDAGFLLWRDGVLIASKKGKFLIDGIAADLFILKLEAP